MRWFGKSWGAPICDPGDHAPTPVGDWCLACGVAIGGHDQGLIVPHVSIAHAERELPHVPIARERPWHLDCLLRNVGISPRIVHVLHLGHSLCGIPCLPKDWPMANVWVYLHEASQATCKECVDAAATLAADEATRRPS